MTDLRLVAAPEDGFDGPKRIDELFNLHAVAKNHCGIRRWRRHDDSGAIEELNVLVQMHLLKAPEIQQTHQQDRKWTSRTSASTAYGCTYLVTPGVAPTLHARARFKLLIKLLFPTLGNPRKHEWANDFPVRQPRHLQRQDLVSRRARCSPTTPTVMAVFMSRLRQ